MPCGPVANIYQCDRENDNSQTHLPRRLFVGKSMSVTGLRCLRNPHKGSEFMGKLIELEAQKQFLL